MKRQAALRQLSSEHHRALVLAKRLRAAGGDAAQLCVMAQAVSVQWREEVAPHFVAEEERLLPLYARFSAPDSPLITETLRQHMAMRALLDGIEEQCAAGSIDAAPLHALGDALRDHVRFEENELFPAIEAALPPEQLQRLQDALVSAR